jgi:hypothetical protein
VTALRVETLSPSVWGQFEFVFLNFFTLFTRRGGDTFYVFFCPPDAAGPPLFGGFGIESSPAYSVKARDGAARGGSLTFSLYFLFFFLFSFLLDPQRRHKLRVFFWDGARRGQIPDSESPVRRIRDGFPEGPFGNSHFTAGGGLFRNRSSMSIVHPSYRVSYIP